jgi:hypothetical protein
VWACDTVAEPRFRILRYRRQLSALQL